jgi:hypothetical protein
MNAPQCPNHLRSKMACEKDKLRLISENDHAFMFYCSSCELLWSVTKPRTKQAARWENQCRRVQQATEIERQRAAKVVYSFPR